MDITRNRKAGSHANFNTGCIPLPHKVAFGIRVSGTKTQSSGSKDTYLVILIEIA